MQTTDATWSQIQREVTLEASKEPILASFLHATILNHNNLNEALSYLLASQLETQATPAMLIRKIIDTALEKDPSILIAANADLHAVLARDSACKSLSTPLLFFKGYQALQSHRVAHWLWQNGRKEMALYLQHRNTLQFAVDIHPAAKIGAGVMLDHATGIVIGETAVVDDDVSLMQSVTLGGTGKIAGDRHPKIARGVMIGPGAKVLGNIQIGEGAKICAGSVVLKPVAPHTTVAGVPASEVGCPESPSPSLEMNQGLY